MRNFGNSWKQNQVLKNKIYPYIILNSGIITGKLYCCGFLFFFKSKLPRQYYLSNGSCWLYEFGFLQKHASRVEVYLFRLKRILHLKNLIFWGNFRNVHLCRHLLISISHRKSPSALRSCHLIYWCASEVNNISDLHCEWPGSSGLQAHRYARWLSEPRVEVKRETQLTGFYLWELFCF